MISKKMTASALALALGTSAIVAPQAAALPEKFVSPPGVLGNPGQEDCSVVMEDTVSTSHPDEAREAYQSGVSAGVALNRTNTEYLAWVTLDQKDERIFERATAELDVINYAENATQSFTVKEQQPGALTFDATFPESGDAVALNVTDIIPANPNKFTLKPRGKQNFSVRLGLNNSLDKQTWAWTISQPSMIVSNGTSVKSWATAYVAPWPFETDNCQPITASDTKSKPIIADGKEYDTGITVTNAKNDYQRLTGNVTIGGKKIAKATVRVDANGKVYVTLPKKATGGVDNNKPAKVDVQLFAQPREETKGSKFEAYNSPQALRVLNDLGRVEQDSPEFTGSVPVQKFAPEYKSPTTVNPGKIVNVALKTQPGDVRGKAVDATYTVTNAPEGWTAEPAKDGTLKVTAPKGAKDGDTATFSVKVTYADGSSDTIKTVVKVKKPSAESHTPGYGEEKGKPGAKVTLTQTKDLPKGSTFTITPGQDLGEWEPKIDDPKTGKITVTIPEDANPGDKKTILVDVKYPDGSTDKKVRAKVTVLNDPKYGVERGYPRDTVILEHEGKVADGSTFKINPDQDLGEWEPEVNPQTGEITVTIPKGAQPGWKDILIDVTDPNNGGKVETVPARVIVEGERGGDNPPVTPREGDTNIVIIYPNVPGVPPTPSNPNDPNNPGGKTIIEIIGKENLPEGGDVTISPEGEIIVIVPKDSTPTGPIKVIIEVTTPDGEKEEKEIVVEIPNLPKDDGNTGGNDGDNGDNGDNGDDTGTPGDGSSSDNNGDTPGGGQTVIIVNPGQGKGGIKGDPQLPEGWTFERDGDNIIVTVPEGTKPGTYPVIVPTGDGNNTTVNIRVGRGGILSSSNNLGGSSENLSKCFENLSSPSNPLLWLLPVGILVAVGAPLAGPISEEFGKAVANVQGQMNIDIPNPFGQIGYDRPQPEFITQIQAETARLQQQFGPAVTQAAAVGLALVGAAAAFGILAAVCRNGGEDLASSKKDGAEGSSFTDLFGGEGSSNKEGSSSEGSSSEGEGSNAEGSSSEGEGSSTEGEGSSSEGSDSAPAEPAQQ